MTINVIVPCAGQAKRFQESGYKDIKPFIKTHNNKMMIEWVIENLKSQHHNQLFTFIFQEEHIDNHNVRDIMGRLAHEHDINYNIITVDGLTDGAASTILRARSKINLDEPLIIANSDQYISKFDIDRFIGWAAKDDCSILTFKSTDSKWSFVDPVDETYVFQVREKEPISDIANVGIFYYSAGKDAMWAIKEMKDKEIKVGTEYYLAPSINELIADNAEVSYRLLEPYQTMWGLGTPFDLKYFIENYK